MPGHTLVKIKFYTKTQTYDQFKGIHTKYCLLGAPTKNDGRKSAINEKHHLIGQ